MIVDQPLFILAAVDQQVCTDLVNHTRRTGAELVNQIDGRFGEDIIIRTGIRHLVFDIALCLGAVVVEYSGVAEPPNPIK